MKTLNEYLNSKNSNTINEATNDKTYYLKNSPLHFVYNADKDGKYLALQYGTYKIPLIVFMPTKESTDYEIDVMINSKDNFVTGKKHEIKKFLQEFVDCLDLMYDIK